MENFLNREKLLKFIEYFRIETREICNLSWKKFLILILLKISKFETIFFILFGNAGMLDL
jgi:hypothetical protein